jgi:hypothetical protein
MASQGYYCQFIVILLIVFKEFLDNKIIRFYYPERSRIMKKAVFLLLGIFIMLYCTSCSDEQNDEFDQGVVVDGSLSEE